MQRELTHLGATRAVGLVRPCLAMRRKAGRTRGTHAVHAPHRLWTARVLRVTEHACEVWSDGDVSSVRFAPMFPTPRVERVSPGHLIAIATGPNGTDVVVWRWYDVVVLGPDGDGSVRLWEPAHGEVLAPGRGTPRARCRPQQRPPCPCRKPHPPW